MVVLADGEKDVVCQEGTADTTQHFSPPALALLAPFLLASSLTVAIMSVMVSVVLDLHLLLLKKQTLYISPFPPHPQHLTSPNFIAMLNSCMVQKTRCPSHGTSLANL